MTVPVGANRDRLMCDVELTDASWQARHLDLLRMHYRKTLHFPDYWPFVEDFLGKRVWTNLSELNHYLITTIARDFLGIGTQFLDSRNFVREGHKLSRLVSLVRQSGADIYISGPAARDYIDPAAFEAEGIELVYKSYADYPEYPQMFPPFEHGVTILDLLFNVGQDAPYYIWGWRESACARERSPPGSRMEQAS
jgi:hypothetical protein